jgi:hypothetical protein
VTKLELAEMLERFIGDTPGCGDREWDDFTSTRAEVELEPYRQRLLEQGDGLWDFDVIGEMITELKSEPARASY